MIVSEIFDIKKSTNLTKKDIEVFFEQKKINPVKWSIVKVLENSIKIMVSYEKNL